MSWRFLTSTTTDISISSISDIQSWMGHLMTGMAVYRTRWGSGQIGGRAAGRAPIIAHLEWGAAAVFLPARLCAQKHGALPLPSAWRAAWSNSSTAHNIDCGYRQHIVLNWIDIKFAHPPKNAWPSLMRFDSNWLYPAAILAIVCCLRRAVTYWPWYITVLALTFVATIQVPPIQALTASCDPRNWTLIVVVTLWRGPARYRTTTTMTFIMYYARCPCVLLEYYVCQRRENM